MDPLPAGPGADERDRLAALSAHAVDDNEVPVVLGEPDDTVTP
ncbi:hypothetical protein [Streptomyces sp. CC219B]|nr:hypothetical protein [Streptomyces sp. CC219B]